MTASSGIFEYQSLSLPKAGKWNIAKAVTAPGSPLMQKAAEQARLKSRFTMAYSQAGVERSPALKYQKQLMGTLAEIYASAYLSEIIEEIFPSGWEVTRYDDVRTDGFESPENEYDIRLREKGGKGRIYHAESRSSITHDRSLASGIETFDIIGPYHSRTKSAEHLNDFYVRPLYEYKSFGKQNYNPLFFSELLSMGMISLYIVGGCSFIDMLKKGYVKSMGQGGSEYKVIKILDAFDALAFQGRLAESLAAS